MLGIIGGTALLDAKLPPLEKKTAPTPYGPVEIHLGKIAFIPRHQYNRPPHKVNHKAHLAALKLAGVDRLIIIGSTGSMKETLPTGSLVIINDWFSPWNIPTFHDAEICHTGAKVDAELTARLAEIVPEARFGTYFQTNGPRFETRAEIACFAKDTDVVGMTAASELTLAAELGIPAAALCTVDNFANGITDHEPTYEEIITVAKQNGKKITGILTKILETFA
ncbi:MAG TPA: MTAP family purine nucleoside phosphorylase [Methanocorpusculum sp.]|nr:MTAP family purine nucleoside phosphorylase [Methanocorpusculum sp.]